MADPICEEARLRLKALDVRYREGEPLIYDGPPNVYSAALLRIEHGLADDAQCLVQI